MPTSQKEQVLLPAIVHAEVTKGGDSYVVCDLDVTLTKFLRSQNAVLSRIRDREYLRFDVCMIHSVGG